jgi:hypothetical protein
MAATPEKENPVFSKNYRNVSIQYLGFIQQTPREKTMKMKMHTLRDQSIGQANMGARKPEEVQYTAHGNRRAINGGATRKYCGTKVPQNSISSGSEDENLQAIWAANALLGECRQCEHPHKRLP